MRLVAIQVAFCLAHFSYLVGIFRYLSKVQIERKDSWLPLAYPSINSAFVFSGSSFLFIHSLSERRIPVRCGYLVLVNSIVGSLSPRSPSSCPTCHRLSPKASLSNFVSSFNLCVGLQPIPRLPAQTTTPRHTVFELSF